MAQATTDLSLLARAGRHASQGGAPPDHHTTATVPLPRRRWKTRVLVPGLILTATGVALALATGSAVWPATPVRVVPVVIKAGVQAAGKVIVQAPGWVEADPFPVAVTALADGVVQEVLVLEGQPVAADQVVARLVDADAKLALAKAEAVLHEARAAVAAAEADLKAAQREWDHPVDLTRRLATSEAALAEKQADLARWPAEVTAEEALAEYKEAEYARVAPLYESGTASQIEFIRVQKEYENQQAMAAAVRARKPSIEAQIAALQAEVVAARENLQLRIPETKMREATVAHLAQMQAAVAAAEAARDEAQLRLDRMAVQAPTAGIVMTRLVEPGSKLMLNGNDMQSSQLLRLYDPQKLQVRVDVPLADSAKVGVGQLAEVVVDVLPEQVFQGHVTRIVNEADVQKNTLQVKVAIENPVAEIKPEMLARARFLASTDARPDGQVQRLLVPEAVVIRHAGGHTMLWLADQAHNVAVSRTITLARTKAQGWVEVETGVQPGDRIIVDPPENLRDGSRIRIVGEVAGDPPSATQGAAHGTY